MMKKVKNKDILTVSKATIAHDDSNSEYNSTQIEVLS